MLKSQRVTPLISKELLSNLKATAQKPKKKQPIKKALAPKNESTTKQKEHCKSDHLKIEDLTESDIIQMVGDHAVLMNRICEVAEEIGCKVSHFSDIQTALAPDGTRLIIVIDYIDILNPATTVVKENGAYHGSAVFFEFPLKFLFEPAEKHRNWYKHKLEEELKQREKEEQLELEKKERAELERLKKKYENR